jgi:hypothetical protein
VKAEGHDSTSHEQDRRKRPFMETTTTTSRYSVLGLVKNLSAEVTTFIRQEINLAKTELSEKISTMGRNSVTLAVGGFVAYAGVIVLLIGLGVLAAWGLEKAGLDRFVAGAIGVGGIGLLITIIGAIMVMKAVKAFSNESLKPERTVQTLQDLKTRRHADEIEKMDSHKPTSEELQASVEVTEAMMSDTLGELGERLSPSHVKAEVGHRISEQPYKFGAVAMGLGLVSGLWMKSKLRR